MSTRDIIFAAAGGSPALPDPNFEYVTLLLDGNGTNGGQNNTFLDSSTNNFTITRNGNTTQGSFSPYGTLWSNAFSPSSSDFLTITANAAFNNFGTGDFTIETWFFARGTAGYGLAGTPTFNTSGWILLLNNSTSGRPSFMPVPYQNEIESTVSYTPNTWNHFAVTRASGTITLWLNGVSVKTASYSSSISNSNNLTIGQAGAGWDARYYFDGYLSNFRIVKGTAVYTSNFTPSTTPLTAISGTSVLTCQSNRFIDNSSNNFAITVSGTPSVQRFSPFNPTAPYSTSVIGGSGYFDGSGDYLLAATGSSGSFGTGDFCVESFFYRTSNANDNSLITNVIGAGDGNTAWYISGGNGLGNITFESWSTSFLSASAPPLNTWNHIAVCRSGTTLSMFLNGTRVATTTSSNNFSSTNDIRIGAYAFGFQPFNGYVSNARVVKGSSVYNPSSTTITVPTAPLTAITNTSLLTNFTNAAIPDYAMMNDLETVGNAQVSTSVKKFGTGSLAFDGSGDWLFGTYNPNFNFGTGSFTIEMWVYPLSVTSTIRGLFAVSGGSGENPKFVVHLNSGTPSVHYNALVNGSNLYTTATSSVSANTWTHIAFVRNGSTWYWFINGLQSGTGSNSTNITFTSQPSYVAYGGEGFFDSFNGYIDDLRVTRGVARYTANFTPPTKAFPTF